MIMVDPPSGWVFGFPKPLPPEVTDFRQWLIDEGYPESEVDTAINCCGCWEVDDE